MLDIDLANEVSKCIELLLEESDEKSAFSERLVARGIRSHSQPLELAFNASEEWYRLWARNVITGQLCNCDDACDQSNNLGHRCISGSVSIWNKLGQINQFRTFIKSKNQIKTFEIWQMTWSQIEGLARTVNYFKVFQVISVQLELEGDLVFFY